MYYNFILKYVENYYKYVINYNDKENMWFEFFCLFLILFYNI